MNGHILDEYKKLCHAGETDVITKIAAQLFGRSPKPEDFQRFRKVYSKQRLSLTENALNYTLQFDEKNIGLVKFDMIDGRVSVTFTPIAAN